MEQKELVLRCSWENLVNQYISGRIVLRGERDMEEAFAKILRETAAERGIKMVVARQETHRGRIVDLRIGDIDSRILIQLKLYHDKADWKESPSMTNTVESDLRFAEGHKNTFVAVIDTIPTTKRVRLPFKLNWQTIKIDRQVFDREYSNVNPRTSPPREREQKVLLAKGSEI